MSSQIAKSLGRFMALGTAAMVIHIGAAVANQRPDIQQQMGEVLSGSVTARAHRSPSPRFESADSSADIQAFARRLLLGPSTSRVAGAHRSSSVAGVPSTSHVATVPSVRQPGPVASDPRRDEDIQAMVRRQLLGE